MLSLRAYRLHLLGAALLLAGLAWHRHATVVSEPGGRFEDPDACFHARRAVRAVAEGTVLPPVVDAFENFPEGGRAVWPPLHDATLTLLDRIGGANAESPSKGMSAAAALPVIELVLALFAAAALARRAGGERGGAIAAWLFATAPVLIRRGAFGEIDHNATEILGGLLLLLVATRTTAPGVRRAVRIAAPALFGTAVLLAMGFYAGLVLSAAMVAFGIALGDLLERDGEKGASLALGFGGAALLLPFFASLRVKPDPADPWRLGPVYVLVLAAGAVTTGLFSCAAQRGAGRTARRLAPPQVAIALGLLAALVTPRGAWGGFAKGLGFIGSRDPWLATIDEFQGIWTSPRSILATFPPLLVGGVAIALVLRAARRTRDSSLGRFLPLATPFVAFALLALVQKRFLPLAASFGAVAAGAAWGALAERSGPSWTLRGALGISLLVVADPLLTFASATLKAEALPDVSAAEAAAGVLGQATPDPGRPPAWGVLAPWDYGHPLLFLSGRAVALNNFGSFHPGFAEKIQLFLEPSPARAIAELTRRKLRYVVAAYPPNVLPGAARSLGLDPGAYFSEPLPKDRFPRYAMSPAGERSLLVRLHLRDGAARPDDSAADQAASRRFLKVWESPEGAPGPGERPVPFMKLFEVVP